jgi:hypothetical protein
MNEINDSTQSQLLELALSISAGLWGESKPWGGAGVGIVAITPESIPSGFYPEVKYFVTEHARNVSWLFNQLREIAMNLEGYRFWKDEFFHRLAVAGERVPTSQSIEILCNTMRTMYGN